MVAAVSGGNDTVTAMVSPTWAFCGAETVSGFSATLGVMAPADCVTGWRGAWINGLGLTPGASAVARPGVLAPMGGAVAGLGVRGAGAGAKVVGPFAAGAGIARGVGAGTAVAVAALPDVGVSVAAGGAAKVAAVAGTGAGVAIARGAGAGAGSGIAGAVDADVRTETVPAVGCGELRLAVACNFGLPNWRAPKRILFSVPDHISSKSLSI